MRKAIAVGGVAAVATTAAALASPIRDDRIRHGAGVGPVRLGMTYGELRNVFGGPQAFGGREPGRR